MNKLAQSLVERINEAHATVVLHGASLRELLIKKVNSAREAGIYLIELQETVKKQRNEVGDDRTKKLVWIDLFASSERQNGKPVFHFTRQTAGIYMRLAEALPEPVTDLPAAVRCLKDVLLATGALTVPDGHGQQTKRGGSFFSLLVQEASRFDSLWKKHDGEKFVREMTPEAKEQVVRQLAPLKARVDAIIEAATAPL